MIILTNDHDDIGHAEHDDHLDHDDHLNHDDNLDHDDDLDYDDQLNHIDHKKVRGYLVLCVQYRTNDTDNNKQKRNMRQERTKTVLRYTRMLTNTTAGLTLIINNAHGRQHI